MEQEPEHLSWPLNDSSFVPYMTKSKKERGRKRRVFAEDTRQASNAPAMELEPEAAYLFATLTDLLLYTISTCTFNGRANLDDVFRELRDMTRQDLGPKRYQYFDAVAQNFVAPSSITIEHLLFIITNDRIISRMYKIDGALLLSLAPQPEEAKME